MGGRAFDVWERVPREFLDFCRNQIPRKRRPSAYTVELVGRFVVQNITEPPNRGVFGNCDETHAQISQRLHGCVSIGQVSAALNALDAMVFLVVKRPIKGRSGTQRTIHPDLALHIARWESPAIEDLEDRRAVWDEQLFSRGYRTQHSGMEYADSGLEPRPPIHVPITGTNKKPIRGVSWSEPKKKPHRAIPQKTQPRHQSSAERVVTFQDTKENLYVTELFKQEMEQIKSQNPSLSRAADIALRRGVLQEPDSFPANSEQLAEERRRIQPRFDRLSADE